MILNDVIGIFIFSIVKFTEPQYYDNDAYYSVLFK